jgi:hypothetical protein
MQKIIPFAYIGAVHKISEYEYCIHLCRDDHWEEGTKSILNGNDINFCRNLRTYKSYNIVKRDTSHPFSHYMVVNSDSEISKNDTLLFPEREVNDSVKK